MNDVPVSDFVGEEENIFADRHFFSLVSYASFSNNDHQTGKKCTEKTNCTRIVTLTKTALNEVGNLEYI